jgi:hypothetical protein
MTEQFEEGRDFDPRQETMLETGQATFAMGQMAVEGGYPQTSEPPRHEDARDSRPHHSTRGGRPYPEKSGRDVSREIANAEYVEPTAEERAHTLAQIEAARMAVRRATAVTQLDKLKADYPDEAQRRAVLRKRADEDADRRVNRDK